MWIPGVAGRSCLAALKPIAISVEPLIAQWGKRRIKGAPPLSGAKLPRDATEDPPTFATPDRGPCRALGLGGCVPVPDLLAGGGLHHPRRGPWRFILVDPTENLPWSFLNSLVISAGAAQGRPSRTAAPRADAGDAAGADGAASTGARGGDPALHQAGGGWDEGLKAEFSGSWQPSGCQPP